MDSISHMVAGALTPIAFSRAPKRTVLVLFGVIAGELPDIDTFYSYGTAEGILSFHRGITHALIWQPITAFVLAFLGYYLFFRSKKSLAPPSHTPVLLKQPVPFISLFFIALIALYTHVYLDVMTTYGTQIFLPFSDQRIFYPSMFIVDLLLLLPAAGMLIYALRQSPTLHFPVPESAPARIFSKKSCIAARIGLLWMLLYPLINLGINHGATLWYAKELKENNATISLMTEPFSPFFWKLVREDATSYSIGTISLGSSIENVQFLSFTKANPVFLDMLSSRINIFDFYRNFSTFIVQEKKPEKNASTEQALTRYIFSDIRYITTPQSLLHWFGKTNPFFQIEVIIHDTNKVHAYRFLPASNKEIPWKIVP